MFLSIVFILFLPFNTVQKILGLLGISYMELSCCVYSTVDYYRERQCNTVSRTFAQHAGNPSPREVKAGKSEIRVIFGHSVSRECATSLGLMGTQLKNLKISTVKKRKQEKKSPRSFSILTFCSF